MAAEGDIDRVVEEAFFADPARTGVVVEVGAALPDYLSISRRFRERGWRVVAVEPNPAFCEAHRRCGYDVLQFACSDRDKDDDVFFMVESRNATYAGGEVTYESFSSLGIEGRFAELHGTVDTHVTQIPVVTRRLDRLLAEFAPDVTAIDLLCVDVEGWELSVMRGLDPASWRPHVVILENLFEEQAYRDEMRLRGYDLWRTIAPNEIYVPR